MHDSTFSEAMAALKEETQPRVWSLIVTVFGDMAQAQGQTISGPVLAEVLAPVGIRPEAQRVALHRLRNDGWIETEKSGRRSLHRLTAFGRVQSEGASARIYASARPEGAAWHIALHPPVAAPVEQKRAQTMTRQGYVDLLPGVYLSNTPALTTDGALKDAFVLRADLGPVPDWISSALTPEGAGEACNTLFTDLHRLPDLSGATVLQAAILRTLIVHRWRRIALRLPDMPDVLMGRDWTGGACRDAVLRTLDLLPRPDLSALG